MVIMMVMGPMFADCLLSTRPILSSLNVVTYLVLFAATKDGLYLSPLFYFIFCISFFFFLVGGELLYNIVVVFARLRGSFSQLVEPN